MRREARGERRPLKKFLYFLLSFFVASLLSPRSSLALEDEDIIAGGHIGGLGGSYAALADGHQSLHINPAGLARVQVPGIYSGFGHYYSLPLSNYHFGYARPLDGGVTAAGGWEGTRLKNKHLDRFNLSWSRQTLGFPGLITQDHRFFLGATFRALSLRKRTNPSAKFDGKAGAGLDAGGLLIVPEYKTQIGASLTGLDSANLDLKGPFLNLGVMKKFGILSLMVDWRTRSGFSTFFPAAEIELYQGLVQIRGGRGARLGELKTVALGMGFNILPLIVDFGLHLPHEGLHRREGAVLVSIGYTFGGKRYYEMIVGRAATEAQNLTRDITGLEEQKRKTQKDLGDAEINLKVLRQEIRVMEQRRREDVAAEELRKAEAGRPKSEKTDDPDSRKPPKPQWPKHHRVEAGDTLRKIAIQYYGDPELWELIYKTNSEKIARGLPTVGEVLTIPKP
ncbi:MAG: hypothetical protein HY401_02205 [Elusimicrobia bacterium]|nr:hypothetical protein [Elusimicrobiota bacterium]